MPTQPDWAELKRLTAGYDFEQCAAGQDQVVFCRVHLKLSEVIARVAAAYGGPAQRIPFLYCFADTLVIDEPFLPARATTIVARSLIVESGTPLVAPDPATENIAGVCTIQLLAQHVVGGPLQLMMKGAAPQAVPLDGAAPESITFVTGQPPARSQGPLELLDLLRHPIAWNG